MRTLLRNKASNRGVTITVLLSLLLLWSFAASAGLKNLLKGSQHQKEVDIYELSLDDNLYSPELNKEKEAALIANFQMDIARSLKKDKYNVELMREGEVVVVTISAGQLFNPNDTVLTDLGKIVLKPFLKYLKTPDLYKMIIVMHSDNTGSDAYTLNLSESRVDAVFDWIGGVASADFVVPYALGSVEPLYPNNSIENRKKNRRLEIYLVPSNEMIKQASSGKINL